jgi:hypothetical protein
MRLEGSDGISELRLTVVGYETSDDVSQHEAANWLESVIHIQTPHVWGSSLVAFMQTWDAAGLANWLDMLGRRRFGVSGIVFPEPNLAFRAVALGTQRVSLRVWFILEKPGEWHMDDASTNANSDNYIGEISLKVSRASLRAAAESWRAEIERFPPR